VADISLPGSAYKMATPQSVLDDLALRLSRSRLPAQQIAAGWNYGTPLDYASRLRDYWIDRFDWRRWEQRVNRYEQRMVSVDGHDLHILVEPGSGQSPLPLILTHGWPGSFLEFIDLIEPLAHPEEFGGRIEDAFTIILPSMPGYGYSRAPAAPVSPKTIASLWSKLAVEHLGLEVYAAQGGDWGSAVTANLALHYPERLVAIHLNNGGLSPTIDANSPPLAQEEIQWAGQVQAAMAREGAYLQVQGTKPQSLAYAQTDSPLGLACWIIEKFQGWTVPGESSDPPFDMDWLLANVMLYWINGSNAASWLYTFLMDPGALAAAPGARVHVPSGFTLFPKDIVAPPPKRWLERVFNLVRYRVAADGGHFPALENRDLMLSEIRQHFAAYR
jgi:pimeloyl-ACP methyl ester carboxylesterase